MEDKNFEFSPVNIKNKGACLKGAALCIFPF
jgi:hypothetical protein